MTVACRCSALTHGRVFVHVVQRQRDQQHPRPGGGGQRLPLCHALPVDLGPFRVIGDAADRRAGEHEVPGPERRHMVGEPPQDAAHILEPVPAGDLHNQGIVQGGQSLRHHRGGPCHPTDRTVTADEPPRGGSVIHHTDGREDRGDDSASSCWFLAEKGSIDGGMIQVRGAGIHAGT
jgi:hypothetical protein